MTSSAALNAACNAIKVRTVTEVTFVTETTSHLFMVHVCSILGADILLICLIVRQ